MTGMRAASAVGGLLLLVLSGCAADSSSGCSDLTDEEIAVLLGPDGASWKGDGSFTVTAAQRSVVTADNDFFSWVVFLQGDAAGSTDEVYVFATASDNLSEPGAGLMGANPFTRERWVWGDVAQRGAPLEDAARDAVADAEACLP